MMTSQEGKWERDDRAQNAKENSPPKFLLVYHPLPTFEVQRCIQDLIRKVCEKVLGIICDRGGDVDILVRLLDKFLVSEGKFEGIPVFLSVGKAGP